MRELQKELGMAILLITHDLGVVAEMCDEVVVMYAGRIAEQGPIEEIFARPAHPYTRGLLNAIPRLDAPGKSRLATIPGLVPGLADMPSGCRFANRCPLAAPACQKQPPLETIAPGHTVACHFWRESSESTRHA